MRWASATPLLGVAFLLGAGGVAPAHAQLGPGTVWERTDAEGKGIVMSVEACCHGGLRLTYRLASTGGQPASTMSIDSPMNGAEAPVLFGGRPSSETMAITRVDEHHYTAVLKMGGQPFGTSTGVVAADGKSLTVESTQARPGGPPRKVIETWVRK
jgi:hypothetical protein